MNATFKLRVEMLEDRMTPTTLSFQLAESPVILQYDTERTADMGQFHLDPPMDMDKGQCVPVKGGGGDCVFVVDESGVIRSSTTPAFQSALAAFNQSGVTFPRLITVPAGLLIAAAPDAPTP
jgi:hypothetical protein